VRNMPTKDSIASSLKIFLSNPLDRGVSGINPFKNHMAPSPIKNAAEIQVAIPILEVTPEYSITAAATAIRIKRAV